MTTSREEFFSLAKQYQAVPLTRELLADMTTPVGTFLRCVSSEQGFILESVEDDDKWSRFSFVGRKAHAVLKSYGKRVEIDGELPIEGIPINQGILSALDFLLSKFSGPTLENLPPLTSGLVGYFGYDVVLEIEDLPFENKDNSDTPDSIISVIGEMAVFDHWTQRVTLISVALLPESPSDDQIEAAYADALERLDDLTSAGANPINEPLVDTPVLGELPEITTGLSKDQFVAAVESAKDFISAGHIFQVVLSNKFSFEIDADPLDVYRVLRQINPSPYMFFLQNEDVSIVGCSPEPLVKVNGSKVVSRPIAGTRPRGKNSEEDSVLAASLIEDPKEVAEHVMLVDLARNDLGRVVEYGSLEIEEMMTLEKYSHVMHLTSQVSGVKAANKSLVDVLKATIPAGTVSGAPKVKAMQIIDDLEPTKRGPYAGLVGYIDFSGNLDSAITIRTMVFAGSSASVQAGAGIVADSDPESEYEECFNKAKALLMSVKPAEVMCKQRKE